MLIYFLSSAAFGSPLVRQLPNMPINNPADYLYNRKLRVMKKIVIGLCALAVVVIGVLLFYNSTKNELEIYIGAPTDANTDRYIESITIAHGSMSYSDEVYAQTAEVVDTLGEHQVALHSEINAPYHIEIDVAFEDGNTIIKYIGTYTDENGVLQDYEHEFIFDFIFTEEVVYPE